MTSTPARFWWMGRTSPRCGSRRCATTSPWSDRTPTFSATPSARTSASDGRMPPTPRWRRRRGRRWRTTSSSRPKTATTPISADRARSSPAVSASASPSPAPCFATRRSSSWTRRLRRSTRSREHQVQIAFDRLMRGRTTIVIAHRLSTVLHADKICVLVDGKVIEQGRHDELLAANRHYCPPLPAAVRAARARGLAADGHPGRVDARPFSSPARRRRRGKHPPPRRRPHPCVRRSPAAARQT